MRELGIIRIENGYLVIVQGGEKDAQGKRYAARDRDDLGGLVRQLAAKMDDDAEVTGE